MKKQLFWYILLCVPLLFLACEGDAGQPGKDLMGSDHVAPVVDFILPFAHKSIANDSALELHVQDDGDIDRVEFLIDGEPTENPELLYVLSVF